MSNHTTIAEQHAADAMVRRRGTYQIGFLGVPEHTSEIQRIFDECGRFVGRPCPRTSPKSATS
jgi:hypothetical protein